MNMTFAVFGMSGGEVVVIVVAILVLFGAKKIPEFARGLGKGINEFKKASNEVTAEIQNAAVDHPARPAAPAAPVQGTVNTTATPADQNPPAKS